MLRFIILLSTVFSLIAQPAMANGVRYAPAPYDNLQDFQRPAGYAGFYLKIPLQPEAHAEKRKLSYGFAAGLQGNVPTYHSQPWQQIGLNRQRQVQMNALDFNLSERGFETLNLGGATVLAGQDNLTVWQLTADQEDGEQKGGGGKTVLYILGGAAVLLALGAVWAANFELFPCLGAEGDKKKKCRD